MRMAVCSQRGTRAVHRVGCSDGLLTQGCAWQNGATPLFAAAQKGHQEVVQLLVKEGADKDAPNSVTVGRELDVGRTNGVCVSRWGLQHGC